MTKWQTRFVDPDEADTALAVLVADGWYVSTVQAIAVGDGAQVKEVFIAAFQKDGYGSKAKGKKKKGG